MCWCTFADMTPGKMDYTSRPLDVALQQDGWLAVQTADGSEGYTRIVTIQNPYSLLNRSFEVGLAEVSQYEGVELLDQEKFGISQFSEQVNHSGRWSGLALKRRLTVSAY